MDRKKKWLIAGIAGAAVLVTGVAAYAYTVNNNLAAYGSIIKNSDGTYSLVGGDNVEILFSPWPALNGQTVKIGLESYTVPGVGTFGVMLADMQGANANNGYLLVAAPPEMGGTSTNVKDVVAQLGGNYNFVISSLKKNNQLIKTYDENTNSYYYYVPFAAVANYSGTIFGSKTIN